MDKEFEALEYFADSYKEFLKGKDTHCQITLTREQATEFVKEVKNVYQAITELKQIKEAKPSVDVETDTNFLSLKEHKTCEKIRNYILKAQEQEKENEIQKELDELYKYKEFAELFIDIFDLEYLKNFSTLILTPQEPYKIEENELRICLIEEDANKVLEVAKLLEEEGND